jgi:hypothetical protein
MRGDRTWFRLEMDALADTEALEANSEARACTNATMITSLRSSEIDGASEQRLFEIAQRLILSEVMSAVRGEAAVHVAER